MKWKNIVGGLSALVLALETGCCIIKSRLDDKLAKEGFEQIEWGGQPITNFCLSEDETRVYYTRGNMVFKWDIKTKRTTALRMIEYRSSHEYFDENRLFINNNNLVLFGTDSIYIYDLETEKIKEIPLDIPENRDFFLMGILNGKVYLNDVTKTYIGDPTPTSQIIDINTGEMRYLDPNNAEDTKTFYHLKEQYYLREDTKTFYHLKEQRTLGKIISPPWGNIIECEIGENYQVYHTRGGLFIKKVKDEKKE